MKTKMIQLLMLFLMISLFVSSKGNSTDEKITCQIKCAPETECTLQSNDKAVTAKEQSEQGTEEYPFALAPGSYMFRY